MDVLAQIFDVSLLATIGLIFLITLVGAYLRSSRRDPCLRSFEHYHITMECVDGKVVWGELELESSGFELFYRDTVQDENHLESSYVMYASEFGDIQALYRYVDDLSPEARTRRQRDLKRYFNPGPVVRMLRRVQHFFALASDSMTEVVGLIMGRLRKPAGRYIADVSDDHFKRFSTEVVGSVGSMFDPLLERLVGKKVVLDLIEGDEKHEHVAVFKNYSPDFYELLDVQYPQERALLLNGEYAELEDSVQVDRQDNTLRVTNVSRHPILVQCLRHKGDEEMLNVVVDCGETVELHPQTLHAEAELAVWVVRELDMVVPRQRCVLRHRADRYEQTMIPEIIFDLGVMLRGDSRLDAREKRLREQLAQYPNSALLASNLGTVLMQKQSYGEARQWLERAYAARYSLPDNGRRTLMLLHELQRRQPNRFGASQSVRSAATQQIVGIPAAVDTTVEVGQRAVA